jgi:predicted GNAT family acetyltransferase
MATECAVKHQEQGMAEVTITRHGSGTAGEYHAHVAGEPAIGRLTWVQNGAIRAAEHTLVPPEIGGRGVAAKLVEALVADAQTEGFLIDPVCSYVAAQFKRHPDWASLNARGQ